MSFVFVVLSLIATNAVAENRWAVIISGASGGDKYAEQMAAWRTDLRAALVDRYQFKPEFVKMFVDETAATGEKGSAENVRKFFAEMKKTSAKDDFVFIVLIGHGTYDGNVAKFNLVGPDMTAKDWTDLVGGVQGRSSWSTRPGSFPFLESLTAKSRVVITATDSAAEIRRRVPRCFVKARKRRAISTRTAARRSSRSSPPRVRQ
jgi:hypothetical protein